MDMETILSRVQALLNKTVEKGCTPEEAAAATALAQNLLFKHNLTIKFNGTNHFENSILYGQLDNDATDKFTRMHGEITVLSIMALDFLLSLNSLVFQGID